MYKNPIANSNFQISNLKIIQHLTSLFSTTFDYDSLLKLILENFIVISNGKSGFIIINDEKLTTRCLQGIDFIKISLLKNLLKNTINTIFLDGEQRTFEIPYNNTTERLLLIPLMIENKVHGIVIVNELIKELESETELELIRTLSISASQKLLKIKIYQELQQKIRLKDILLDISDSIEKVSDLKDVFDVVMKKLANKFDIIRGMLFLLQKKNTSKLSVYTAYNLTDDEISKGVYKVGEGIVGRVVENGKSISISDINKDKIFLNRMKVKRAKDFSVSFIAVPIRVSGIVTGVLAIEKKFESKNLLKDEEDMLLLISGIISNKVKKYQKLSEEKTLLLEENINLKKKLYEKYGINNIIGKNKEMLRIFEIIRIVAASNTSILILGESGTGKELVAKALHFNSHRREKPFISINCAAIPENLLESELFGHTKGAFTGAEFNKKGKFLLADGGTLFLDEIGDMPLYLQAKLLRAIQEKEIEPIGSECKIKIDIRIISATNKDPALLLKNGRLRKDLFYRLNVVEIVIPSLKDRIDDIPLLTCYFIDKYTKINNKEIKGITPEALKTFQSYHWPGNVRELENIIERAILLCKDNTIDLEDLPNSINHKETYQIDEIYIEKWINKFLTNEKQIGHVYNNFMKIIEKEFIKKCLLQNNRNKLKTSEYLGITRNTLRSKIKNYNIKI